MNTNQTASELDFLRTKVATLEQLLNAYEDTVSGHARHIDDTADRIKTQASLLGASTFAAEPMNTGDFFHSLVYILAPITGAKYVVAGELAGDDPIRIDTLAVWGGTDFIDNFSYDLSTTPCQNLLYQSRFVLEAGTRDRFPHASVLAEWNAEGYVGVPIYGTTGRFLGVLTVVHDQPLRLPAETQSMVTLFAARAGAELERRRTERALRESEARYRGLVENVLDVIFTLSPAGTIESLNPAFVRATGWQVEEWIGKPFAPLVHPDDLPLALDIHQRVMRGEIPATFCVRIATSGGDYLVKEITVAPNYQDGKMLNALGVARDITERHKADEILKALVRGTNRTMGVEFFRALVYELATALEVKYAFVTELLPGEPRRLNVVASWEDGQWGQGFDYLLEGSPSEIASRNGEAFYRTGVQRLFPHNTHLARLGADSYIGVKVTGCNGDPLGLVFALDARPMERAESVRSILAIFAERAGTELERMRTERALRQSEERYTRATAAGKVGVWELDVEHLYYHGGSSLKALLGYAEDELSTAPADWLNLVHPDDRSIATDQWQTVMTGERADYHCELRMLHKTGTVLWTEVRGHAIRNAAGHLTSLIGSTVDITDRKQAEERLRESEERYRLIFEATPDPLLIVGFDGFVRDGNPAACRAYGYEHDELICLADLRLTDPSSPQFHHALKTVSTGHSFTTEGIHVRRDGSRFPVDVHISPFQYRGERVMLSSVRDITKRKELEWRLQESINRFDVAVHGSQDGLWDGQLIPGLRWHDPQTPVWWSPRTRELLGFSSDEFPDVLGSWLPLIHPDDKDRVFAAMTAHMQYKVPYDIEYRLFTRSGECRWHRAKGQAAWDEYGNPVRMSGSTSDITERKLAEEALRESEERYRTLIELSPCGVLVNCDERIAYINQAGLAILGAETSSQMLDRSPFDIVTPDDQDIVRARIRHMFETGESLHRLARTYLRLDGTVVDVEVEAAPITWNGRPAIQVIFSDITERKRAEEALRASEDRFRAAYRNAAVGMSICDLTGRLLEVNPVFCAILGRNEQELLGMDVQSLTHPADHDLHIDHFRDLRFGIRASTVFDKRYLKKDGSILWAQVGMTVISDANGQPSGLLAIVQDITERKRAEDGLRKSERDLRLVLETLPVGVWFTDMNERVILCNPKAREIWSGSAVPCVSEERSHRWWEDAPNRSESHCRALRRALTNGENTLNETMAIVCVDGAEKTIHNSAVPVRAEDGTILGAIVVNEDVTDRLRLEEQAQLFRTLMDHSSDAVFMCDPTTGQFLDVNASACRHLGYSREELLRLGVPDIEDIPADKDSWAHLIAGLKRTGSRTLTGGYRRRDGSTFPVEVNAGFVSLGRGDFIVAVARDISDRKRAEEQLRRSEERFRSLIQYSSDIITILNPDGTIRYESPAFYRLFGYREEEILGRSAFEFVHPDDLDRTMQIFGEKLHVPGLAEPVVFNFRKADGGYLTLEAVGNNLLHDPNIQGIVVNCRDVTERIRAEEALRASEAKLRTLADHAPVSIFMADPHGNCVYVNQRWCDRTGYTPDQASGRGWLHTLPSDERQHIDETRLGEHLAGLSPAELEFRFVTRTGTIRWAEGSTIPLQNAQHEVTGYISTSTDITERRRAEEELRRSHAFVRQIIDTDPNFIFAKDREGRFTLVNKAIANCYGTTVDELIGKTDADFNPNREEVAFFRQQDLEVMNTLTDRFIPEEIITDSAGNRRWLQTVKRPLVDEYGRAIQLVGAASDITARKHVEEALRQREHDLQAALQERERISQELHDGILQSLYAVGLGLETCKSMLRRNPRKAARTLERAVTQLNALMREVRNFIAGLESELLQGGDLVEALRTVVQSIAVHHGLPFRVAIDRKAARHITREQSLHVLNIVREAVSNSLRHAKASCGQVSLRLLKHSVRVTIRDNGIGFTPDRAVGLGHGLHNMAARAKRIGGHLTIDSKPKRGTRILFDLPKEHPHAYA